MIHGFSARMLEGSLTKTNEAMDRAAKVHSQDPFWNMRKQREEQQRLEQEQRQPRLVWCRYSEGFVEVYEGGVSVRQPVPFPQLSRPTNCRHPFSPENAFGDRHLLGVGNSSNIVVDSVMYEDTVRKLDMVDDQAGEEIYRASVTIDEMCSSMYVVPETGPRVRAIADRVKSCLGEFRALTENTNIQTRRFVNEIRHIDQADDMFTFVLEERAANEVVRQVNTSMNQQADNMRNTVSGFRTAANGLRDKANEARSRAEFFKQKIMQLRGQLDGIRSRGMDLTGVSTNQDMREFYRQLRDLERQMRNAERNVMSNSFRRF